MQVYEALTKYRRAAEGEGDAAARAAIPTFNERAFHLGRYADGSLLRLRGVIRDVQDPELVVLASGEEADAAAAGGNFEDSKLREKIVERIPLKVALFPFVSPWATHAYEADEEQHAAPSVSAADAAVSKGAKRANDAVNGSETSDDVSEADDVSAQSKKSKATTPGDAETQETGAFGAQAISMYVYDGQYPDVTLDAFRVNEAFEFVGILDLMVLGSEDRPAADSLSVRELQELQVSDCLGEIQRKTQSGVVLHCCDVTSLDNIHHVRPNESMESYKSLASSNEARKEFCVKKWRAAGHAIAIAQVREQLVGYLSTALAGDAVAAEYLLLCLLSRVYARADPTTPLGNLSLNLVLDSTVEGAAKNKAVQDLLSTLRSVVPMVVTVNLSLENLNGTKFAPHKNYEQDVLVGGALQVANGTVMVIDETALSAGQLNEQGVKNMDALQSLVGKMLLPYDFQYYSMDFPQDVAIVTVSEAKSILPVTVSIPVRAEGAAEAATTAPVESLLDCFRVYLSVLRSFSVSIGNEEAEMAEKHYVDRRKAKQNVQVRSAMRLKALALLLLSDSRVLCVRNMTTAARRPAPVASYRAAHGSQPRRRARLRRLMAANARPRVQADGALEAHVSLLFGFLPDNDETTAAFHLQPSIRDEAMANQPCESMEGCRLMHVSSLLQSTHCRVIRSWRPLLDDDDGEVSLCSANKCVSARLVCICPPRYFITPRTYRGRPAARAS